jgi:hypothetical protein
VVAVIYTVRVTREHDAWLADVVGLEGAHTFARTLGALDGHVREVIALVENLEDGAEAALHVRYEYRNMPDDFIEATRVGDRRAELGAEQALVAERTEVVARRLVAAGVSMRDIAVVLRMSPGRVSQIVGDAETRSPRPSKRTA